MEANLITKTILEPVVFDVDGTLRCGKHRLDLLPPLDQMSNPRAFDAMNLAAVDDTPIWDTIKIARALHRAGHPVILLTRANEIGREILEDQCIKWDIPYAELYMADYDDCSGDREYKEMRIKQIEQKYGRILAFWDDQPKVCAHIRSLGYTVYHVEDPYELNTPAGEQAKFN
ncbi:polynucleotide kinase (plasmid) [Halobacteriovorax sp. GFR7]|uniref:phosphatase domain-containing protein n=1 Tax=unclassified Halobacteriovorax TaxID=2639665 RepID=UPI003D98C3C2